LHGNANERHHTCDRLEEPRRTRARDEDPDRVPTHAALLEREAALSFDDALADLERNRRMVVPPPTIAELAAQEAAILAGTPFLARLATDAHLLSVRLLSVCVSRYVRK
jgi:DNA-directed RNA polymerase specialized sigma24 family protein